MVVDRENANLTKLFSLLLRDHDIISYVHDLQAIRTYFHRHAVRDGLSEASVHSPTLSGMGDHEDWSLLLECLHMVHLTGWMAHGSRFCKNSKAGFEMGSHQVKIHLQTRLPGPIADPGPHGDINLFGLDSNRTT